MSDLDKPYWVYECLGADARWWMWPHLYDTEEEAQAEAKIRTTQTRVKKVWLIGSTREPVVHEERFL